jgi:hypothetical protein
LPRFSTFSATAESDHLSWPPKLYRLQISGKFYDEHEPFLWPEQVTHLALDNCSDLSFAAMSRLLANPHLPTATLRWLSISTFNRGLQSECIELALLSLPSLVFLSFPGSMISDLFFGIFQRGTHTKPLALEVLELAFSEDRGKLEDGSWKSLICALNGPLANVRMVGFHYIYNDYYWFSALDDVLRARFRGLELPVSKETENFCAGLYSFNAATTRI